MYRILIGEFSHETNSFCPIPADEAAFLLRTYYIGEETIKRALDADTELGGFYAVLGQDPNFELVPAMAFSTGPCGLVSGNMYDRALSLLIEAYREKGPFDGILLNMHGAMVAEGHPDAEGDFLASLRTVTGPDIPIFTTLDLHGNLTEKMARNATVMIPCEEYPHTDSYQLAKDVAQLMKDTIEGRCKPTMAFVHIPYLLPLFPTKFPEISVFLNRAKDYQNKEGVRFVRIAHGFFPANIPEMGMSVIAVTDGNQMLANAIARELADAIWEGREPLVRHYTPLDEALDMIDHGGTLKGPIVLGDGSDNPGAGGLCDTTHVTRRILERGIKGAAIAVIRDPENVQRCIAAGIGASLTLEIGGTSDPKLSGGPLRVAAVVERITDGQYRNQDEMEHGLLVNMGPSVVLRVAGNQIVISTQRCQVLDAEGFRACGIDPTQQKMLIVKSAVHYRASFGKFAGKLIDLALPGFCAPDPEIFQSLGFHLAGEWKQTSGKFDKRICNI